MDGSLFTDQRVWTVEALQSIDARVSLADIGSGSWLDKLEVQVEALGDDEILLAAELVFVLLLPQSDTGANTKREQLGRVLALLPDALAVPERLDAAFDGGGVANFSTAKSWTPALLRFIIRLAIRLKELTEPERDAVLSDAWAFRDVVDEVRTSTDQMMANAIKHVLFQTELTLESAAGALEGVFFSV
jgi:5-methylcytosine-specific restriction protein B